MSSMASLRFSSCTGSFCWLRASTQPAQSRSCTASSRPPSVGAASVEWYVYDLVLRHRVLTIGVTPRDQTRKDEDAHYGSVSMSLVVSSLCPQFVFLTYILGVAWLGVFGFSAVPVFLFYNMWSTCATMRTTMANLTNIDSICVDVRQYGKRAALRLRLASVTS